MLAETVWRRHTVSNTALEQRITPWRRCGVTLTCHQQQAELPDLKAAMPDYGAIHSQVWQDVLARLDRPTERSFAVSRRGTRQASRAS
jgi:putative transposase